MKSKDSYLMHLHDYANNNILDINYDKRDKRTEIIKSILHGYGTVFNETLPGNDLYSYKFEIKKKGCEIFLYINHNYNLMTQSEYLIDGRYRRYSKISLASEYPYIVEIIKLGFVYVNEDVLFAQVLSDGLEESCRLSPFFYSVYFEDI